MIKYLPLLIATYLSTHCFAQEKDEAQVIVSYGSIHVQKSDFYSCEWGNSFTAALQFQKQKHNFSIGYARDNMFLNSEIGSATNLMTNWFTGAYGYSFLKEKPWSFTLYGGANIGQGSLNENDRGYNIVAFKWHLTTDISYRFSIFELAFLTEFFSFTAFEQTGYNTLGISPRLAMKVNFVY